MPDSGGKVAVAERLARIEAEQRQQANLLAEIKQAVTPIPALVAELQETRRDVADHEHRLRSVEHRTSGTWEVIRAIGAFLAGLLGGWGSAKGGV